MEVLVLFGSPHPAGATAALLEACLRGLGPAEIRRFNAFEMGAAPCDDCRYCHTHPGCRHRDLDDFCRALEQADLLIFAAPVYNRSFPAPMKGVLDRLQRYWAARFIRGERPPIPRPKRAILLTAGGSTRRDGRMLATQLAPILTVLHSAPALAVHAGGTDSGGVSRRSLLAAEEAAETIRNDWERREI